MLEWIKKWGAFGILLTLFIGGITLSGLFWSTSNTNLQIDLRRAQEDATKARAELASIKESLREKESLVSKASPSPSPTKAPETPNQTTAKIYPGNSASLFDDAIIISVTNIPFGGPPLRYRVDATIGAPGIDNIPVKEADVGYVTEVKSQGGVFEVRLIAVDSLGFSATFSVTRKTTNAATK
jgi:hypothetical protein